MKIQNTILFNFLSVKVQNFHGLINKITEKLCTGYIIIGDGGRSISTFRTHSKGEGISNIQTQRSVRRRDSDNVLTDNETF